MADERLRCGDRVRVIGPAAASPGDTFAIGKETTVAELRTDDEGHTVYACQIRGWGFVPFPRASLERIDGPAQADEPRALIRHFAAAMERKLAANDGVKGGWHDDGGWNHLLYAEAEMDELKQAMADFRNAMAVMFQVAIFPDENAAEKQRSAVETAMQRVNELKQAVLDEAADVANYLMFACDVIGALPPTDERGR